MHRNIYKMLSVPSAETTEKELDEIVANLFGLDAKLKCVWFMIWDH